MTKYYLPNKYIIPITNSQKQANLSPKILILTWECYPVFVGGLGVLVKDLLNELKNQKAEVTLLLPYLSENHNIKEAISLQKLVNKYLKKDLVIDDLNFDRDVFEKNKKKYEQRLLWKSIFHPKKTSTPTNIIYSNNTPKIAKAFAFAVQEWLKKSQKENYFDCILGMDWVTIPTFKLLKNLKNPTPFVFYINSTEYERSLDKKVKSQTELDIESFESRYFGQADHVIAVSGITRKILERVLKIDPNKITVVLNDTNFEPVSHSYKLPGNNKYVLFLGRLTNQKGLHFLIDTAQKVVEIDSSIHFLIVGDGEILPEVVEHVAHKHLEKNVHFLGWADSQQKKVLYNTSNLFVMPSPSEPFGLTALESIKSGVPVIASTNCGFVDLVKSTPTFRYHDTQSFANLILFFLHNQSELKKLLEKQKADLQNHSWKEQVSKVIQIAKTLKKTKL